MLLDLNDPESIVRWWTVWPERHDAFLEYALKASPQFAPGIREAQRRIAASEELSAMLASSVQQRHDSRAESASRTASMSAYELRIVEFA